VAMRLVDDMAETARRGHGDLPLAARYRR
jgi:hypothetical protein